MRSLDKLIDRGDPAWPLIQQWISTARNAVEILPVDRSRAEATLIWIQVTTRSTMGAIALETGGLLIDSGWLRILGSGSNRLPDTLLMWNGIGSSAINNQLPDAFIIGHDAIGGFFALNGGAFGGVARNVFYFAPDTLHWQDLGFGYSDFLQFALGGDLARFYAPLRWPTWREDAMQLNGDQGYLIYPFLWAKGEPVAARRRSIVPMRERWTFHLDTARKLKDLPPDTQIRVAITDDKSGAK